MREPVERIIDHPSDGTVARLPGKRARTDQLLPQRKGANASVTTPPSLAPSSLTPSEDPFGLHLLGTAQEGVAGSGTALPFGDVIQASFGRHDIGHARAHLGADAATAAGQLDADAYTLGADVAFAAPPTLALAAHEAAHIVQQTAGIARKASTGIDSAAHEQHADAVAAVVVRGGSAEPLLDQVGGLGPTVQRKGTSGAPAKPAEPLTHLGVITQAITSHVSTLGAVAPAELTAAFKVEVPALVGLLQTAASLANTISAAHESAPADADATYQGLLALLTTIEADMARLFALARDNRIEQAAVGLDQAFLAEDAVSLATGRPAPNRRAGYYADLTAEDMRGVTNPATPLVPHDNRTGAGLIKRIEGWFAEEPVRALGSITSIAALLQEPVRTRPVSTLEQVIEAAVRMAIGAIPAYLIGVVGGILSPGATPVPPGSAPAPAPAPAPRRIGFPMNTDPQYVATQQAIATTQTLAATPPDMSALTMTVRNILTPAAIRASAGAINSPHGGLRGAGALSTAFVISLVEGLDSYRDVVGARTGELGVALATVPPQHLEVLLAGLTDPKNTAGLAKDLLANLIMQWANVVTAATTGLDAQGGNAHGGTLEQALELPGTVQMDLVVRKVYTNLQGPGLTLTRIPHLLPHVDVTRIEMTGMSSDAIDRLRAQKTPLAQAPLHRTLAVSIEDAYTGALLPLGRIDVGPAGQFGVEHVRWAELAMLVDGDVPEARATAAEEATAHAPGPASRAKVVLAAEQLLAYAHKTTADIP